MIRPFGLAHPERCGAGVGAKAVVSYQLSVVSQQPKTDSHLRLLRCEQGCDAVGGDAAVHAQDTGWKPAPQKMHAPLTGRPTTPPVHVPFGIAACDRVPRRFGPLAGRGYAAINRKPLPHGRGSERPKGRMTLFSCLPPLPIRLHTGLVAECGAGLRLRAANAASQKSEVKSLK